MKRYLALPLLLFAAVLPAWGEIPMELVAEIPIAAVRAWDVQHAMNDTALAVVYSTPTTIYYRAALDAPLDTFALPESLCFNENWDDRFYGFNDDDVAVAWLRLPTRPDHLCVFWQREWEHIIDFEREGVVGWLACIFDLTTEELVDSVSLVRGSYHDWDHGSNSTGTHPERPRLWPPLPALTEWLVFAETRSSGGDGTSDHRWWIDDAALFAIDLSSGLLPDNLNVLIDGRRIQFYEGNDEPWFAYSGYYYRHDEWGDDEPPTYERRAWVGTYNLETGAHNRDTLHGPEMVLQRDATGVTRMIVASDSGGAALDPTSLVTLWENPALNRSLYAARFAPAVDELILHWSWDREGFGAYYGVDGALADSVSPFLGHQEYVLKHAANRDLLITSSGTGILRAYALEPPPVTELTCRLNPADGMIYLRWRPVGMATAYHVWAGAEPGQCDELVATVEENIYAFPVTGAPGARFFHVTVEY